MGLVTGKETVVYHVNPIPMKEKIKNRVEQLANNKDVGDLEIRTVEITPLRGIIQYQNVGVDSDEESEDDELDNVDIAEVSDQRPRPIRMEWPAEFNRNSGSDDSTIDEENEDSKGYIERMVVIPVN